MSSNLKNIAGQFLIEGEPVKIYPFGSGHINDTYKIETTAKNYLLQRINHQVFKNVSGLTENLVSVTGYLKEKVKGNEEEMEILQSIKTLQGGFLVKDSGNFWRVLDFIEDSYSYDRVENERIAYEGGKSFGWFVKMLTDYPASELVETIPDFHNAFYRIKQFQEAVKEDVAARVSTCAGLVDLLAVKIPEMSRLAELYEKGEIPVRVTHNDTKINNILFDAKNKGKCIIDLDTVMPGLVHFDFGDAMRTFTNTADEDEKDLSKIEMKLEYFSAFAKGFLLQTKEILNQTEIDQLVFSGLYITYEQSIRFLTDYLLGDPYYKIKYNEHNLVRARAQAKLLESMEDNYAEMQKVVNNLTG